MKKINAFVFAVAIAATALVGCTRETDFIPSAGKQPIFFSANSVDTRTSFGTPDGNTYPVLWDETENKIKVMLNMSVTKDTVITPSADRTSGSFSLNFTQEPESYTFFSLSPASAHLLTTEANLRLCFRIPDVQTPTATSVDPAAQIMLAKSETSTERPQQVALHYKHFTSYGLFDLTNLDLGDDLMKSVSLTAEENWTGKWFYFFNDDHNEPHSEAMKTITVNTNSPTGIWFACAPIDMSGKTLTVTVNGEHGTVSKTFTFSADRKFVPGQIARFSLDMSGASYKEDIIYEQVMNLADLTGESLVIIAANVNGTPNAINTYFDPSKTFQQIATGFEIKDGVIKNPPASVEIYTVDENLDVAKGEPRQFAFMAQNGEYLYTQASKDGLWRGEKPEDAGAWFTVSIEAIEGVEGFAYIKSVLKPDANQRNIIKRHTASSTGPMFNLYRLDQAPTAQIPMIFKLKTE